MTDRQGSVRQIADTDGVILDAITYDSFGNILSESNPSQGDRFKHHAREWEAAVDLYSNRARWYSARDGAFISEDPLGFDAQDTNLARYVGNNPVNQTDPTGLFTYTAICRCSRLSAAVDFWVIIPLGPRCTPASVPAAAGAACRACCGSINTCFGASGVLLGQCFKATFAAVVFIKLDCLAIPDPSPIG